VDDGDAGVGDEERRPLRRRLRVQRGLLGGEHAGAGTQASEQRPDQPGDHLGREEHEHDVDVDVVVRRASCVVRRASERS